MLKKRFSTRSNSAVAIEDDVDDDTFLKNSRSPRATSPSPYGRSSDPSISCESPSKLFFQQRCDNLEDQKAQIGKQKQEIEQRALESTKRSLSLLRDSEEVGIAAAQELTEQGEKLENTNQRLDEINENLHYSGRHIQGISSIFGSFKNYWSNRKSSVDKNKEVRSKSPRSVSLDATSRSRNQLQNALDRANTNIDADEHPAFRIRGVSDTSQGKSSTDSDNINNMLDNNLEKIAESLTRLKGLAQGLGNELDSQNHLLDDVISKTEKADINIERQNKDINRLLRK